MYIYVYNNNNNNTGGNGYYTSARINENWFKPAIIYKHQTVMIQCKGMKKCIKIE